MPAPRVFVRNIDEQWEADLCDMSKTAKVNDGYKFILTVIDVLSKYAWAQPVKNKTAVEVKDAMKTILMLSNRVPKRLHTDQGTEFYNHRMKSLLKKYGIVHFSSNSANKACVVERFNRTIKSLIYKHFTASQTYRWKEMLQSFMKSYNERFHRSIKMAPKEVSKLTVNEALSNLYPNRRKRTLKGRQYKPGDLVRISRVKGKFEKGYLPSFSEEIFKVMSVHRGNPTRYSLEDLLAEKIEGKFAPDELTRVRKDINGVWKVEKIIYSRNGRHFVKWSGFPAKFNSWVSVVSTRQ